MEQTKAVKYMQAGKEGQMDFVYSAACLLHDTGLHPENRRRLDVFAPLEEVDMEDGASYLKLVHTAEYILRVQDACQRSAQIDQDTYCSPGSFLAATYAVGATIKASETGGFALVRPPGHHAYAEQASGFCLFNNVAVATQKLVEEGKRVLIFDFDGHLGDGTMDIFYESDQVMFWSIHQYPAYPGHGFVDEIGRGKGEGYNIMTPLPAGSADDIFLDAVDMFLPVVQQFEPDVLAISAGFDTHQSDLLLDLKVSRDAYYQLGQRLQDVFPKRFAVLEGGYNQEELRRSTYAFLAGMNGVANPFPETPTLSGMRVHETYEINLHAALSRLRKYWKL